MIPVEVLKLNSEAEIPQYMTSGSAGCDVKACLPKSLVVEPGARVAVPTGLAFAIPKGYEIQVRPRSGLALKKGLTVINAPGTIDSDYRGEVMVLLINLSNEPVELQSGERIAQLVLQPVSQITWKTAENLDATDRGVGGFGSTGIK